MLEKIIEEAYKFEGQINPINSCTSPYKNESVLVDHFSPYCTTDVLSWDNENVTEHIYTFVSSILDMWSKPQITPYKRLDKEILNCLDPKHHHLQNTKGLYILYKKDTRSKNIIYHIIEIVDGKVNNIKIHSRYYDNTSQSKIERNIQKKIKKSTKQTLEYVKKSGMLRD